MSTQNYCNGRPAGPGVGLAFGGRGCDWAPTQGGELSAAPTRPCSRDPPARLCPTALPTSPGREQAPLPPSLRCTSILGGLITFSGNVILTRIRKYSAEPKDLSLGQHLLSVQQNPESGPSISHKPPKEVGLAYRQTLGRQTDRQVGGSAFQGDAQAHPWAVRRTRSRHCDRRRGVTLRTRR